MGNHFEFSVVSDDERWAEARIAEAIAEVQRIEVQLTTFQPNSQTNQINSNAGIAPVPVDKEVFDLIERALRISALTQVHSILRMDPSIKNSGTLIAP